MFEEIVTIINVIKTLIHYSLYCGFKIGQCLVYICNTILNSTLIIFNNLIDILNIIIESFSIFCQDILQGVHVLLDVIDQLRELLNSGFSTTSSNINNVIFKTSCLLSQGYNFIGNAIYSVLTLVTTLCKLIKHIIILLGAGVWFAITFLPFSLVSLVHLVINLIKTVLQTISNQIVVNVYYIKDCFKNIYEFVTDVPVESTIGLTIAVCLIYTLTQFYVTLYQTARQAGLNILNKFRRRRLVHVRNFRRNERSPNNLRSRLNRRPQIRRTCESSPIENKNNMSDERYCVICQERIKCVLVLPCRHVCMCMECNTRLQLYNNTCPICRNDIESTMKIFV